MYKLKTLFFFFQCPLGCPWLNIFVVWKCACKVKQKPSPNFLLFLKSHLEFILTYSAGQFPLLKI